MFGQRSGRPDWTLENAMPTSLCPVRQGRQGEPPPPFTGPVSMVSCPQLWSKTVRRGRANTTSELGRAVPSSDQTTARPAPPAGPEASPPPPRAPCPLVPEEPAQVGHRGVPGLAAASPPPPLLRAQGR